MSLGLGHGHLWGLLFCYHNIHWQCLPISTLSCWRLQSDDCSIIHPVFISWLYSIWQAKSSLLISLSSLYSPTHPFPFPFTISLLLDITVDSWTFLYVLALLSILCSWQDPVVFEHFAISWKKKFQAPFVLSHFSYFFEKLFFSFSELRYRQPKPGYL